MVSLTSDEFDQVDISPTSSDEFYLVPAEMQKKYMTGRGYTRIESSPEKPADRPSSSPVSPQP
ncbi:hypothetical protein [Leporid alphaherpesvirus 4]|uniref:Uncharacterized protein n=1 Tax=Leporid alphaherpesvirus 4 TaxID=481315 RepID=J9R048_9ALPH|nr:hypothetical protein [Leporid alphaherpesvirus 4]AFR32452.1 hypothetical protein [Leporid alphaherpesvirus 4]